MRARRTLIGIAMAVAMIPGTGLTPASAEPDPPRTVWDDATRLVDAIDDAPSATGSPLLTIPYACWSQQNEDTDNDAAGDIDYALAEWNCGSRTMRLTLTFQDIASTSGVEYVGFDIDTDGHLSNHCGGAEYAAIASRTSGTGGGRLVRFGATCEADYVSDRALRSTGLQNDPVRMGLEIPLTAIGNATVIKYRSASVDENGVLMDAAPNGSYRYGLWSYLNSTLGLVTTFVNGAPISISGSYSHQVPGDFNGDGRDDIALVGNGPRADALKLGSTNGFITRAGFALNGSYDCVVGTDFDADGDDDLILIGNGPKLDAIKRGGPNGFVSGPPLNVTGSYAHCLAGDYNADGRGDIALIAHYGGTSLLKRSNGTGTWSNRTFTVTNDPDDATSGDFNQDGYDDLLLPAWGADPDTWLKGSPTGFLVRPPITISGTYDYARAGDFNADTIDDVLYYGTGSAPDMVRRGLVPRSTAPPISVGFDFIPIIGDYDGNGTADVVWHAPGTATDLNWRGVR